MRNVNAPIAGIVEPAESAAEQAIREGKKRNAAVEKALTKRNTGVQEHLRELLSLGEFLAGQRVKHPTKGPKAKSWGDYLAACAIPGQRAWEAMKYAGYVEKVSPDSGDTLPDLRDAGIDTKPRKSGDEEPADTSESAKAAADWDIVQMKMCERVKSFATKLPDDKKGDFVFSLRQLADTIEEMKTWKK